jgi:hypothetical protein
MVKELYQEWLRYPNSEARAGAGLPKTRLEFAKKHHVDRVTMWRWEQDLDFKRGIVEPMHAIVTTEDWMKIVQAQREKALAGNLQAAKWIGDIMGIGGETLSKPPSDLEEQEMAGWSAKELEEFLAQTEEDECVSS